MGHPTQAVDWIRQALAIAPDNPAAHSNLGEAYRSAGRLDEAIASFRRAIHLKPDEPGMHCNLGLALADLGQSDAAVAIFRRALALQPDNAAAHSSLIHTLHLHPHPDDHSIDQEHQRWNQQFSSPLRRLIQPHASDRHPDRRLRIGYVSPDFRFHAAAFFFAPLLEAHDRQSFEIYCYASVLQPDAVTERLRKSADLWRDVRALSDAQLAGCVRADRIDILVDLAMHTAGNRLPAFARRPAPVQVSWLAYPGSTGLEAIDYRLTDAHLDPPDREDDHLGGTIVRLPDAWCCYAPLEEFPAVSPLPAMQTSSVTFGSLNQFSKIHQGLLHCWAKLLAIVPTSRLLMVCPQGSPQDRTHALFAAHGIAPERVQLVAPRPWPEYLRLFAQIDIALDSYPCNGMTTTCHALWMGLPVVSLAGTHPISRAGSSLLNTVGLPEWVAHTEEEYVHIAASWAANLPLLAQLRATLRPRIQASPLTDAPRFARHIETAYRSMWHRWTSILPPMAWNA